MADKYLTINRWSGEMEERQSLEMAPMDPWKDGGKLVATNYEGTIDQSLLPRQQPPDISIKIENVTALERFEGATLVTLVYDEATRKTSCKRASAADISTRAHGMVTMSVISEGNTCTVYIINETVSGGVWIPGEMMYLGVDGEPTAIPPTTPGSIVQSIGTVIDPWTFVANIGIPLILG